MPKWDGLLPPVSCGERPIIDGVRTPVAYSNHAPRIMIIIIIIKMDVCSLLVSLVVLCSPLTKICDGVIPSATDFLENYLCGDGPQREGTELKLATNVTHYIDPGSFCVVQNFNSERNDFK